MVQRAANVDRGADRVIATLAECGFVIGAPRLDDTALHAIAALFEALPEDRPGARVDTARCMGIPAIAMLRDTVADMLGRDTRAVRAVLFDKRDGANWALGWHQDRTIEVAERVEVPGFGPFTEKQGRLHVAPPIALVERMMTVRIHIDAVDADNAPLLVMPGSHRLGFVFERKISAMVKRHGEAMCLAEAGDVWFYATPILHRSTQASAGRRRRVLQMDFCAEALPGGLRWAADA